MQLIKFFVAALVLSTGSALASPVPHDVLSGGHIETEKRGMGISVLGPIQGVREAICKAMKLNCK